MRTKNPFPRLKSVQVSVEERKVVLELSPGTWRTHMFTGLETIPERLAPVFSDDGTADDLNLLDMVRKAYKEGLREFRHEAPYTVYSTGQRHSVLRTVIINVEYLRKAGSMAE